MRRRLEPGALKMEKLLLIDDEADVQYSFRRLFASTELAIHTASGGEEGLKLFAQVRPDIVVSDVRMAGMNGLETLRRLRQLDAKVPIILMTAYGTTQTAIEAMKLGAFDYVLKPFDIPKLKALIGAALKASRDMREAVTLQPTLSREDYEVGVVGRSEAMQNVFKLIGQLAGSDATVLITGESGTGKELVARAIYHHSRRSTQSFLAINCAALSENLLESELFGHEKGAFTGASSQRIGKFEQCHRGTLFLDEIGDMSPATQTRILRVLQEGTFERVGGNQTVTVDVRVIAATNKLLEKAVAENRFREDLFYRLNVVRLQLPPLRERKEDIRLLVDYFLRKLVVGGPSKAVGSDTLSRLEAYQWPGNVRELENVIRRALVVSKGPALLPADLPAEIIGKPGKSFAVTAESVMPEGAKGAMEEVPSLVMLAREMFRQARADPQLKLIPAVERVLVIEALRETQGNQVHASKLLGITRATLRKRIEKFEIRRELNIE